MSARYFLIATGSNPSSGDVHGLESVPHLTPRTALDVIRPPKRLFIIGAGATGCEFANLFSAFGSKVYLADSSSRILPKEDQEVSEAVSETLHRERGVSVLTHAKVIRISRSGVTTTVTYLSGSDERSIKVDEVLLAAGEDPMVDLGLENARVEYTKSGIKVNEQLATSQKHIFAAGSVLGQHALTHVGVYEGRIVANNILHSKQPASPDYTAVPRVTFMTPEVASVGLSEEACLKRDLAIKTAIAPLNIIARSTIDSKKNGFVKIIADKKGQIVGASIVAPHAGDMIHELTLAIQYEITAAEVAATLHAFPTWSEAVRVACARVK
jgi:dihydrolipoamide dehydrogenase